MSITAHPDPICPVCHQQDTVAGLKVHDKHGWWHRCTNEHGTYILDDGAEVPMPQTIYFTDDGLIDINGKIVTMTKQEVVR